MVGLAMLALTSCSGRSHPVTAPPVTAEPTTTSSQPAAVVDVNPPPIDARSATFVSASTGWVLARQECSVPCPQPPLFATRDGGETWRRLSAPVPPVPPPQTVAVD